MADHLTIDDYLHAMRTHLRNRHDRVELLDEVEDHLRSTAERHVASGRSPVAAESETIGSFGDPLVIADALADANGAAAVPTHFTRSIGRVAMIGSLAWVALPVAFWSSHVLEQRGRDWEGTPQVLFMGGTASLAAGASITLLLMLALRQRHGGFRVAATVGVGVCGLAVAASMVAWAIPLWTAILAIGCGLVAAEVLRRGSAPTGWAVTLAAAWPAGLATLVLLRSMQFGEVDEWGDYPAAYLTGMTVGCALMTASLIGLGHWLGNEQPVDGPHVGSAMAG